MRVIVILDDDDSDNDNDNDNNNNNNNVEKQEKDEPFYPREGQAFKHVTLLAKLHKYIEEAR